MGPKTRARRKGEVNLLAARLARTLGEPAPSPKRRGHRNGVDDTRASWDAVHGMPSSFANSAAPSPIHPLGSGATQHNPPQPETPAGSISGRESAPSWGPTGNGSAYHSPSKKDRRGQIQTQIQGSNASPESGKSARTQDDPHVLSHTHDFDASSGMGDLTRTGSNARTVNNDVNDALDAEPESESGASFHLRERLRGAEARERLARTALEDAEARSRLDVAERIRVEGTARHLEATVAKFAAQNEEMLAAVKRQTQRAVEAERIAKSSQRDADAASLSDARRLEVAMKAGYLARYWHAAFALGVAPHGYKREADVWIRRAPPGGDDALVRLMRRAANAGAMGEAQTVGPTAIEFFNGKEYAAAGDGDGVREGGGADGLENNKRWRPTTLADAVDVEIAMRVMSAARVEESVLVALADRRRALETRAVPPVNTDGLHGRPLHETPGDWITLSEAETAEVVFRRAWLAFVWWRARGARVEPGLAEGRCEEWFRRVGGGGSGARVFAAAREALEVEEGLKELRELGVEAQLWRRPVPSRRRSLGPGAAR